MTALLFQFIAAAAMAGDKKLPHICACLIKDARQCEHYASLPGSIKGSGKVLQISCCTYDSEDDRWAYYAYCDSPPGCVFMMEYPKVRAMEVPPTPTAMAAVSGSVGNGAIAGFDTSMPVSPRYLHACVWGE